jgi:hypothetical protein
MASLPFFHEASPAWQHPHSSDDGPGGTQKLKRPVAPPNAPSKSEHEASQTKVPRLHDTFALKAQSIEEAKQQVDRLKLNVDL